MTTRVSAALSIVSLVGITFACTGRQWGIPRVELSVTSPDGKSVAMVRNHANIDPPSQTLWLALDGGEPVQLRALAGDNEWCDRIAWSPGSDEVGFLIKGGELLLYDAKTRKLTLDDWLVPYSGEYPPQYVVRELSFLGTGSQVSYRYCDRRNDSSIPFADTKPAAIYDDVVTNCTEAVRSVQAHRN